MAIKTSSMGTLPTVELNYIQFTNFNMTVGESPPHRIAVSGKMRAYGVDNGVKYYAKDYLKPLSITDLDSYIMNQVPAERRMEAAAAMIKVQEGLGVLASITQNVTFEGVE
jgi:hypothetical protein